MAKRRPKKSRFGEEFPPPRLQWAPALFGAWAAFVLAKTLPGSAAIFQKGLTLFPLALWSSSPRVVSPASLTAQATLDGMMVFVAAVAAYGIGMPIVRRLFAAPAGRLERALLAEGIGLGVYAAAVLFLGIVGVHPESAVYSVAGAGIGLNAYELVVRLQAGPAKSSPEAPSYFSTLEPLEWAALAAITYAAALHCVGALAPETSYDSLAHHLALPNIYIQRGAVVPLPTLLHANLPQNMEMLYLSALVLRGETAAKLTHLWMGVLSCLALYEIARTACSRRTALLAVALFASIPVVGTAAWRSGVELAVTFWSLMGAWTLIRGLYALSDRSQRRELAPRWLVVSGAFFGFALGAHYSALWAAAAAGAVLLHGVTRAENLTRGLRLRLAAIWLVAAVSALAPWLLKNVLFVANPVHPFLGTLFSNGLSVDAAAWAAASRGEFWHGGAFSWKTWLLNPWELFAQARDSDSFTGPVLIAFAPLALLWRKAAFPFGIATALFAMQYALWASSTAMTRLLIPALPLFCLFAAQQLTRLAKERRNWAPWLAVGAIAWNLSWSAAALDAAGAPGVVFGFETASDYRERPQRGYFHPYADAALWVDENLPHNAKILLSGESRSYPISRTVTAASLFDPDPLLARLRGAAGPQDLYARLKALGYTHLLIGHGEAARARGKALRELSPEELELLSFFLQAYAHPILENEFGVVVYELRPPAGPVFPVSDTDELPALVRLAIAHGARF